MAEKTKLWWIGFIKGWTMFHTVGTVCVFLGFFIGDVPETILKRAEKLTSEAREIEKDCTVIDKVSKKKICFIPVDDIKSLIAASKSLAEDAKKIIGTKGELNALGLRVPFQVTGAQILGLLIFFFGTLSSILKSRFGKGDK